MVFRGARWGPAGRVRTRRGIVRTIVHSHTAGTGGPAGSGVDQVSCRSGDSWNHGGAPAVRPGDRGRSRPRPIVAAWLAWPDPGVANPRRSPAGRRAEPGRSAPGRGPVGYGEEPAAASIASP